MFWKNYAVDVYYFEAPLKGRLLGEDALIVDSELYILAISKKNASPFF